MLESILNFRLPNEIGKHGQDVTAAVAQFMNQQPREEKKYKAGQERREKSDASRDVSDITCYECGKKGHHRRDYRSKGKRTERNGDSNDDDEAPSKKKSFFKKRNLLDIQNLS